MEKSTCDNRSSSDRRVPEAQSTCASDPTEATWWFNSRCLPSVGGPLTDAELNNRPLPERVVQHLVDALFHFYELYASTNSPRIETKCVESAASIYGILRNNGIEVVIFSPALVQVR